MVCSGFPAVRVTSRSTSRRTRRWSRVGSRDTIRVMSAARDELRELVEQLPDDEVSALLADVRRHVAVATRRPWPPAFFGAGRGGRSDVAERSEDTLDEGFGRPA